MWRSALTAFFLGFVVLSWNAFSCGQISLLTFVYVLALLGPHNLWVMYHTLPRDTKALSRYLHLRYRISKVKKRNVGIPTLFQEIVRKQPDKVAFYFEDEKWTFQQVEDYSNRVANYFRGQGVKHGDCVALYMENRVEYICIWLGLTKLGAVPALVNHNLQLTPLKHCIDIVKCISIISSAESYSAIHEIQDELGNLKVYISGSSSSNPITNLDAVNLDEELKSASTVSPPEINNVKFSDKMVYIYTSGTTGLPKAAVIKHSRCYLTGMAATLMLGFKDTDVVYSPLPLYHLAAGILAAGQALLSGLTVVYRPKLSISQYWTDCIKYKVTVAQYIGEICRYLLNTPEKPEDTQHQVKVMFGNGLRPQIWDQFEKRFGIERISEFYGATEGNANIINMDGKQGAIGFLSVLIPRFYPCALIKVDEDTGTPLRNHEGVCIRCKPGEPGEFVGKIVVNDPVRDFHGYADQKATESKIVRDVWKKGDAAFLSGDVLVMDEQGYLYFLDRRGDTFRWKGENVSTTEVEGIISKVAKMTDVVVYGVQIPGAEGKAGMAAILDPEGKVDLEQLGKGIAAALPSYAQPLFIRLVIKLDMTGTYKLKKINLQKEGFDLDVVKDKLYFLDLKNKAYSPLTKEVYEQIQKGEMRL